MPERGASSAPDLSVVIPVYNEEENLPPLWAELRSVLEGMGLTFEVVFVDDGSHEWEVMYQKTRAEVLKRRLRL